ncbi:MAG: hypothetical protein HY825_00050 [Acidobacteria bacterium]|nr:hypothetical protein [Acidobacteriota bacterium]
MRAQHSPDGRTGVEVSEIAVGAHGDFPAVVQERLVGGLVERLLLPSVDP